MELQLDRNLSNKRIFPAVTITCLLYTSKPANSKEIEKNGASPKVEEDTAA